MANKEVPAILRVLSDRTNNIEKTPKKRSLGAIVLFPSAFKCPSADHLCRGEICDDGVTINTDGGTFGNLSCWIEEEKKHHQQNDNSDIDIINPEEMSEEKKEEEKKESRPKRFVSTHWLEEVETYRKRCREIEKKILEKKEREEIHRIRMIRSNMLEDVKKRRESENKSRIDADFRDLEAEKRDTQMHLLIFAIFILSLKVLGLYIYKN
jgi:hypothetical protein